MYPELPPYNAYTDSVPEIYPLGDIIPFDYLGQIDPSPLIKAAKDASQIPAIAKKYIKLPLHARARARAVRAIGR